MVQSSIKYYRGSCLFRAVSEIDGKADIVGREFQDFFRTICPVISGRFGEINKKPMKYDLLDETLKWEAGQKTSMLPDMSVRVRSREKKTVLEVRANFFYLFREMNIALVIFLLFVLAGAVLSLAPVPDRHLARTWNQLLNEWFPVYYSCIIAGRYFWMRTKRLRLYRHVADSLNAAVCGYLDQAHESSGPGGLLPESVLFDMPTDGMYDYCRKFTIRTDRPLDEKSLPGFNAYGSLYQSEFPAFWFDNTPLLEKLNISHFVGSVVLPRAAGVDLYFYSDVTGFVAIYSWIASPLLGGAAITLFYYLARVAKYPSTGPLTMELFLLTAATAFSAAFWSLIKKLRLRVQDRAVRREYERIARRLEQGA